MAWNCHIAEERHDEVNDLTVATTTKMLTTTIIKSNNKMKGEWNFSFKKSNSSKKMSPCVTCLFAYVKNVRNGYI